MRACAASGSVQLGSRRKGACRVVPCVQPPLLSRPQGSGIRQEEPERAPARTSALRERGLGAAFPPFQQPAGRSRNPPAIESAEKPSTWRKRRTDLPGFPTFRQAPGRSRNPPPIEMLKTPVFSGNHNFVDDEYNPFVRHAPVKTMGSSTTRKTVIRRSTVTWIR